MSLFVFVFFTIYGLIHALFYRHVKILFPDRNLFHRLLFFFLFLMVVAPIITLGLQRRGYEFFTSFSYILAFSWMGFITLNFSFFLIVESYDAATLLITKILDFRIPCIGEKKITSIIVLFFSFVLSVYGYFEANQLKIERIKIVTKKLPANIHNLKIAQISDVHLGVLVHKEWLELVLDKIKSENPDILFCTGDFIDSHADGIFELSGLLKGINPKYGKFAVTGNHEVYANLEKSIKFIEESGFKVLKNEAVTISGVINIAGVHDSAAKNKFLEKNLFFFKNDLFTILLKHRPEVNKDSLGLFDLQLSGHTHKGQIFPFTLIVRLRYNYVAGYYELKKGSKLYVNRGTGTWGPRMRVLSPPEITIIELINP
ncbi:MAG: metallophosphoesterase [Desulfobacterales bacterium]|nr:metallophosphoesterase [Desulfobacterales bacterium]